MAAHCEHLAPGDVRDGAGCWYATRGQAGAAAPSAVQWIVVCDTCNEQITSPGSRGEMVLAPIRLEYELFSGSLN